MKLLEAKALELSTSSLQGLIAILKNVFNFCYNNAYIDRMPFNMLKIAGKDAIKSNNNSKIIDSDTFDLMISDAESYYQIAFYIAYYTGCRLGEVLALTWNDIDFDNDTITVNKSLYLDPITKELIVSTPKTKTSNAVIPLANQLKDILIEWRATNDCNMIVNRNNDYISPSLVKAKLRRFNNKHKKHVTFHMFRHTYTTNLYMNGIDPKTAQRLLRHKDFNTTMSIYTHLENEDLKEKIDKIFN